MGKQKIDSVALDIKYEQLVDSTEKYVDAEYHVKWLVDFYRERGLSNLADDIYRAYYSLEDEHNRELFELENVKAAMSVQFANDLIHRNLDYQQNQ